MREIDVHTITQTVARLCQDASFYLPADVRDALVKAVDKEESPLGKKVLGQILENAAIAESEKLPICQDTGVTMVYLWLGQDVHLSGGELDAAVQEGVRRGYREGYLRKSMVRQPFTQRINTGDNTPAVIHTEIVPGDKLRITVLPKGAGSENMSRLFMLNPSAGRQGIIDAVVLAVDEAGSNPCPPLVVGVGIGGTADKAMELAKQAVLRQVGLPGPDAETAALEADILREVNRLGIGPEGLGGRVTALAVHVEAFPAHIGSLPLAVNLQCHALRRSEALI